jgi:hypothetical protein
MESANTRKRETRPRASRRPRTYLWLPVPLGRLRWRRLVSGRLRCQHQFPRLRREQGGECAGGRARASFSRTFFCFVPPLPNVASYSSSHTVGSWLIMLNSFNLGGARRGRGVRGGVGRGRSTKVADLSGFSAFAAKKKATDMSQASECTATSSSHL